MPRQVRPLVGQVFEWYVAGYPIRTYREPCMAGPQGTADEANRLYWNSELSVAEIATRLDLSRRALYDLVRPLPADAPCPDCGAGLGYTNRSARDSGRGACAACAAGVKGSAAAADAEQADGARPAAEAHRRRHRAEASPAPSGVLPPAPSGDLPPAYAMLPLPSLRRRALRLGAVAFVGLAAGVVAALYATRD
jgi:hypothetical protein